MGIESSSYSADAHTQADGRTYITESHLDTDGKTHTVTYLAPADWSSAQFQATMEARAVAIATALAEREIEELLGNA